jgi:DGQHR domain-containing protein
VTVFIGADISDQAHIFSTVNLEQTKVNKSLAYDLYELSIIRSPQKTCHNIAVALDQDETSPLYHRIKRLGIASADREFEPISQANFVDGIMRYISEDPKADRDLLLRGVSLKKLPDPEMRYFLRDLFIDDRDIEITQIVYNYFSAVRERWPVAWRATDRGFMLNRTNGFRALVRFMRDVYKAIARRNSVPSVEQFLRSFEEVQANDRDFVVTNFPPGTSGESRLLKVLRGLEPAQREQGA